MNNLFDKLLDNNSAEYFVNLHSQGSTRIERIVSPKNCKLDLKWYDQEKSEWILLVEGEAEIEFIDSIKPLKKGDYLLIPPHKKHRVISTSKEIDTIWLAVFH